MSGLRLMGLLFLGMLLGPALQRTGLLAQREVRLAEAVRLAHEGMPDSARRVVARILAATQPGDSIYPEVLYTTGLLAATEGDRRLALRRVAVEYGQSEWADDALLLLAQLDYAVGNPEATVRQVEQLVADYPASPLQASAALWGARAGSDRREPATACRLANLGLQTAGTDIELRNQLEFQRRRCEGLLAMQAEAQRQDSINRGGPARRSGFYVQLSAVATQAAANTEIARARRAGYSAAAVRESGLFKIRIGPYSTRAGASQALAQARSRLGGQPFVVRVP